MEECVECQYQVIFVLDDGIHIKMRPKNQPSIYNTHNIYIFMLALFLIDFDVSFLYLKWVADEYIG